MLRAVCFVATAAAAAVKTRGPQKSDLVTSIPGFEKEFKKGLGFEIYSGYLDVKTPAETVGYDALKIHYEFHTCQKKSCPLAVWHQGGPGGSAVYGAWTETGPFQIMAEGAVVNEHAWNNAAHMLYLESPAGSTIAGEMTGFSSCYLDGKAQSTCSWNDVTQAVAYAHTLEAFFDKFPQYKSTELFLAGESYAGQYIPNIANHIVTEGTYSYNITGIAVGNGCWGGTETSVQCNGPHAEKNDVDIFYGKAMLSPKLYESIQKACDWEAIAEADDDQDDGLPLPSASRACNKLLDEASTAVGPYNIYDVYDDCPLGAEFHAKNPAISPRAVKRFQRERLHLGRAALDAEFKAAFGETDGGYPWNCESDPALDVYFTRDDVRAALNLGDRGSSFRYDLSGPASQLLYPTLVTKMRVLIFNGDADLCVPFKGNEELVGGLEKAGSIVEKEAWQPWYRESSSDSGSYAPSGYVTTYDVPDKTFSAKGPDFAFLTIRLAGHMVPTFQPEAALAFFSAFVDGKSP